MNTFKHLKNVDEIDVKKGSFPGISSSSVVNPPPGMVIISNSQKKKRKQGKGSKFPVLS